jgi:hypothetical protein
MDALRAAASLGRVLLAMGETDRDCDLLVMQRTRCARLSLTRGKLVALAGLELEPLGDTLLGLGVALSSEAELCGSSADTPIGARLVARGTTSRSEVRRAVQVQLTRGMQSLLRWPSSRVELAPRTRGVGVEAAIDLTSALWCALLQLANDQPGSVLARLSPATELTLTRAGQRRLRGLLACLACGELERACELSGMSASERRRLLDPLPRSSSEFSGWLAARPAAECHGLRALLFALGAVVAPPERERGGYTLLLRKRRELSRNVSASALLDLPEAAGREHVRHAFKRLAHQLHPDRFHTHDARIQAVSAEVMGALVRAERALCGSRRV